MPAAIGPLIGLGTSIIGGITGRRAANRAGEIQSVAGEDAARQILEATERGITGVTGAGEGAAAGIERVGGEASHGVRTVGGNAVQRILESLGYLNPYSDAGSTAIARVNELTGSPVSTFAFDPSTLGEDPGYQFRKAEAEKTLKQNAAALGSLQSGGFAKALLDRASQEASQEVDKMYGRQLQTFNTNQATQNQRIAQLLDIMGFGERANQARISGMTNAGGLDLDTATTAGGMDIDTTRTAGDFRTRAAQLAAELGFRGAEGAGDYRTGAAAARSAGVIGGNNAIQGMLGNISRIGSGVDWRSIFKPRTPTTFNPSETWRWAHGEGG